MKIRLLDSIMQNNDIESARSIYLHWTSTHRTLAYMAHYYGVSEDAARKVLDLGVKGG